MPAGSPTTDQK